MKKTSRKAIAVIISAAMVFTSFATSAFAAGPTVGKANLYGNTGSSYNPSEATAINPDGYEVSFDSETDTINVKTNELVEHYSTAGEGKCGWLGFSIIPEESGVTQMKYYVDGSWSGKTAGSIADTDLVGPVPLDGNANGTGDDGIAWFFDGEDANGKSTAVAVQWFDAEGNAVSDVLKYDVNVAVLAPIAYPEPIIDDAIVGGTYTFSCEIPEGTFGKVSLHVKRDGADWKGVWQDPAGNSWTVSDLIAEDVTEEDTGIEIKEGDQAYVLLQLFAITGDRIPLDEAETTFAEGGALANSNKDVRSRIVKAEVETFEVTVDVAEDANGTVTADPTEDVAEGDIVTLTVTADEGYEVEAVTATAEDETEVTVSEIAEDGTCTFEMPAANVTVTATFVEAVPETFDVIVDDTIENGQITVTATEAFKEGDTVTFTVTADEGYEIGEVTATAADESTVDVAEGEDGTYTFTMPAADVTVTATFTEIPVPTEAPIIATINDVEVVDGKVSLPQGNDYVVAVEDPEANPEGLDKVVYIEVDGAAQEFAVEEGTATLSNLFEAGDGEYTIYAKYVGYDDLVAEATLIIDGTEPEVVVGDITTLDGTITVTVTDELSDIDEESLVVTVNGDEIDVSEATFADGAFTVELDAPLKAGDIVVAKASDVAGNEGTSEEVEVEKAELDAPTIVKVNETEVDGPVVTVNDASGEFTITFGDAEVADGQLLPAKVFEFNGTVKDLNEDGTATVNSGDFEPVSPTGEYSLKVWYEGYEDQVTEVTLSVIDEVEITEWPEEGVAYNATEISGKVTPNTAEVTITIYVPNSDLEGQADGDEDITVLGTGTATASDEGDATWTVTGLDLTPYINQSVFAKATVADVDSEPVEIPVTEPAAPEFVSITYTDADGNEVTVEPDADGNFFVGSADTYIVEFSDGENEAELPEKEFTASGEAFDVVDNKATITGWTPAADGNNELVVKYVGGSEDATATATLTVDTVPPEVTVDEITTLSTEITGTVTDDNEVDYEAGVVATINGSTTIEGTIADDGTFTITLDELLAEDDTVVVSAKDAAGNVGESEEAVVVKADLEDPEIVSVNDEAVSNGEVFVNGTAPFVVQLGDGENEEGITLPAKVFTFDGTEKEVADDDTVELTAGDFGDVASGDFELAVYYEGYEDQTVTVILHIISEVTLEAEDAAYSDGKVTGTVTPGTSEVTIYADEDCAEEVATATVADDGTWEAEVDLTAYIGGTLYAKAICSGIESEVVEIAVSEPAAPEFVTVTYTNADGEEVVAELDGDSFYVGNADTYIVEFSDGENELPVPDKEFTANGTSFDFDADTNTATISSWTPAEAGTNELIVKYVGAGEETYATAYLVIDSEGPEVTIDEPITTLSTEITGTVTDDNEVDYEAGVVATINGSTTIEGTIADDGTFTIELDELLKENDTVVVSAKDAAGNPGESEEAVVELAELADPEIVDVNGEPVSNGVVSVNSEAPFVVQLGDGENEDGITLPAKVFTFDGEEKEVADDDTVTLEAGDFGDVATGDHELAVWYEGYEEQKVVVTLSIIGEVTLEAEDAAYNDGKVTGTVAPSTSDVNIFADETLETLIATATVADDGTWEAEVDLTPYIGGTLYAKAICSNIQSEVVEIAVSEPEAPVFVTVTYTNAAGEEVTAENEDGKFYVGKADTYAVTLADAEEGDTVPAKEFTANDGPYEVVDDVATITGMSTYDAAECEMTANYVNGTNVATATLVIDGEGPTVTVDELTTISTAITGTVEDDNEIDYEAGVVATINDTTTIEGTIADDGSFEITLDELLKEGDIVVVSAKDAAGNVGESDEVEVTAAEIADPEIVSVNDEAVSNGEVFVNGAAPFTVQLGDGENEEGITLPAKVFTFDGEEKEVADDDTVTLEAGDFGEVQTGDHELVVWYEGYEDQKVTVTMHIIGEVTLTADPAEYITSDTEVTGTVEPNTSEVTIYSDEDCTEAIATAEVADDGKWTATFADGLVDYINSTIYAKAVCSEIESEVVEITVGEPEAAPTIVKVTYNNAAGEAVTAEPDEDGNIYVGPADAYDVEFSDGENAEPLPEKEFTANGTEFTVSENAATISSWTPAADGNNPLVVNYAGAEATSEYTLVIDNVPPTVEIADVYDSDTTVSATVEDAASTIAGVVFTIGEDTYEAAYNEETGTWDATIPAQAVGTEITAVATDSAGNESEPVSTEVLASDIAAIEVTTEEATVSTTETLTFNVVAEEGRDLVATISVDGGTPAELATVAIGDNVITASETFPGMTNFAQGEYTITVSYADPAYEELSGSVVITVIGLSPAILDADCMVVDNEVEAITGKAKAGTTAYIIVDETTVEAVVDENGNFTIDVTGVELEVGENYRVEVKDDKGNVAEYDEEYTQNLFTVVAADIAQIVLTTDLTFDDTDSKYYVDSNEAVANDITVHVEAEEGYDVKVTISGQGAYFNDTEFTITSTGNDDVTFVYNEQAKDMGYVNATEYTVSAEYVKAGFEDQAAEDIIIAVTLEEAVAPTINTVNDRDLEITGTTSDQELATVEVSFDGETWEAAEVSGTDWTFTLEEALEVGSTVYARLTSKSGNVAEEIAETTVIYADVIDLVLEYDEDDAEGTTASKDGFGFKLTADEGRNVVVKVSTTVNGVEVVIDDWNEAVVEGAGEPVSYFAERNASDTELAEGVWTVKAWYEDEEAMQAQIDNTELEDQPIHEGAALEDTLEVKVIGAPGTPELVEPDPITNRTEEITVTLGENAKTAKVYTMEGEGDSATLTEIEGCTVEQAEDGNWTITLPAADKDTYIKAGTTLAITEIDKSEQESEEPLVAEVAYDEEIAIEITATSADDDMVIDAYADEADIVISGTTTLVYDGTDVEVSFVSSEDESIKLNPVTVQVSGDAWEATFDYATYKSAIKGLDDGDYTVTARVLDEKPDVSEGEYTEATTTITIDTEAPEAPEITGSTIDGEVRDLPITTRSEDIQGTAEPGTEVTVTVTDADGNETVLGTATADEEGNWSVPVEEPLNVGDSVSAVAKDAAGHESEPDEEKVQDATAQDYDIAIDALENPFVNTAEGGKDYQVLTFTGTTTAHDTDEIFVHIEVESLDTFNDKVAEVSGGTWTVTFGGESASAEEKAAVEAITTKYDGQEVIVSAGFVEEGVTVTDSDTENNETTIYPDMTAPEAPTIENEVVSNRTTELNVTSNTEYTYAEQGDCGTMTVYIREAAAEEESDTLDTEAVEGATDITDQCTATDNGDGTWTITIPEQSAGTEIFVTETDKAGNESEISNVKVVEEAKEDESGTGDPAVGTVDELVITKINDEENEEGVEEYYVNNTSTTSIVISGKAANENVQVSFEAEDGTNADTVFTTAKSWTVSDNAWEITLNVGALQNNDESGENKYEFTIVYTNSENSDSEGVVGEAKATIIIDITAPDAPVIDEPVTDRADEITGTAEPGSEVTATITDGEGNETVLGPVEADPETGEYSIPLVDPETEEPIELEIGDTVEVVATDAAGNESEPAEATVEQATSDSEGLPALVITGVKVNGTSATITGKKAAGEAATLTIKNDDKRNAKLAPEDETFEVTFENFADGKYTAVATYDDLGDEPAEKDFTVGSKPSGGGGGGGGSSAVYKPIVIAEVTNEDQPTISGTGEPNKEIEVFIINTKDPNNTNKTGDSIGKTKTDKNGNWSLEYPEALSPIEPGEYKVTAQYTLGENSYTGRVSAKFAVDPDNTAINNDNDLLKVKIDDVKYYLNGKPAVMDSAPFIDSNDRTMLPVRVVANALGISDNDITWDDETKTATFLRADGKVVSCTVGSNVIMVGDEAMVIDTVPVIRNDRIYLPMRALFNAFNVSDEHIIWNGEDRTVTVTKEALDDIAAVAEAAEAEEAQA